MTLQVTVDGPKYVPIDVRGAFFVRVQEALAAVPEFDSSTMASVLPLRGGYYTSLRIGGRPDPVGEPPGVTSITVGTRYFETLRLSLLRGRSFTPLDGTAGNLSAVVNQRFVDMFFPNEDPIGRLISLSSTFALQNSPAPLTIVGVSPTVRQISSQEQPDPVVYVPFPVNLGATASFILRPRTDLATVVGVVRREVSRLDRDVPVSDSIPLEEALIDSPQTGGFQRRQILLLGVFAAMAVVLAAVGIYAVTAYTVAQRIPEIGLRMALGARTSQVVGLFVGQAMRPLALGVFVGLGGAFVAGRLLQSWLVKPAPVDPLTLVIVAVLLVLIGLTAAFYPSWRGARVDPSTALRIE